MSCHSSAQNLPVAPISCRGETETHEAHEESGFRLPPQTRLSRRLSPLPRVLLQILAPAAPAAPAARNAFPLESHR